MWGTVWEWAKEYVTNKETYDNAANWAITGLLGVIVVSVWVRVKNRMDSKKKRENKITKQQLSEEIEKPKQRPMPKVIKTKGSGIDEIRRKKF